MHVPTDTGFGQVNCATPRFQLPIEDSLHSGLLWVLVHRPALEHGRRLTPRDVVAHVRNAVSQDANLR